MSFVGSSSPGRVDVLQVMESAPTQLEGVAQPAARAAKRTAAARLATSATLPDAVRLPPPVVREILVVSLLKPAVPVEAAVNLGTTVLRSMVNVDAARTAKLVLLLRRNVRTPVMLFALAKTSAAHPDTRATVTRLGTPSAALAVPIPFHPVSEGARTVVVRARRSSALRLQSLKALPRPPSPSCLPLRHPSHPHPPRTATATEIPTVDPRHPLSLLWSMLSSLRLLVLVCLLTSSR